MGNSIVNIPSTDVVDMDEEMHRRLCQGLGMTPEDLAQMAQCSGRVPGLEKQCNELIKRCSALERLIKASLCPANIPFSSVTLDRLSKESQVNITEVVKGIGNDYVDEYPVPPGKRIRLIQQRRPGYSPASVTIALNLDSDAKNYLDLAVRFYVTTDPEERGEQVGGEYRGFQFFNADGIPTPQDFPTYKNLPMTIGTEEYLVIEIEHYGQKNNLLSAFVAATVNVKGWYLACGID